MLPRVYLDTARLGRMSPSAQLAQIDFARWAGEQAGSLYFDDFLQHGSPAMPPALRRRYRGLAGWRGISYLKRALKTLAWARRDSRLLLANRSSQLMRFAAKLLYGVCRNVLVTDLSWPNYADILGRRIEETGRRLTRLRVREAILRGRMSAAEFIVAVATAFRRRGCEGLFLPAVDNQGVRLPLQSLVCEIRQRAELRFAVVDGAQALGHVPLHLGADFCDFYIAGCHKWLRAGQPLGLGFYGRPTSQKYIDEALQRMLASYDLDDPLLTFAEELECGRPSPFGETVNLAPLFTANGAVHDALSASTDTESNFAVRLANAEDVGRVAAPSDWTVLRPATEFRNGIVLLQSRRHAIRAMPPNALRRRFLQHGIAVTTYAEGVVRLSMPDRRWQTDELAVIEAALESQSPTDQIRTHRRQSVA